MITICFWIPGKLRQSLCTLLVHPQLHLPNLKIQSSRSHGVPCVGIRVPVILPTWYACEAEGDGK